MRKGNNMRSTLVSALLRKNGVKFRKNQPDILYGVLKEGKAVRDAQDFVDYLLKHKAVSFPNRQLSWGWNKFVLPFESKCLFPYEKKVGKELALWHCNITEVKCENKTIYIGHVWQCVWSYYEKLLKKFARIEGYTFNMLTPGEVQHTFTSEYDMYAFSLTTKAPKNKEKKK